MFLDRGNPHQGTPEVRKQCQDDERGYDVYECLSANSFLPEKSSLFLSLLDDFLLEILLLEVLYCDLLELVDSVHSLDSNHNEYHNNVVEDQTGQKSQLTFPTNVIVIEVPD